MKYLPRIIVLIAALSLLTVFIMPMWRITLVAPQYPDGISLHIWINKIGGDTPGTLQNINILNHYIGMQSIDPDAIPELKYFPFVTIGLFVLGLIAAMTNNWKAFLGWTILLILTGMAGIYDFYLWEYDYGHNLDPNAPIQIPGETYQPPLIGTKMLLNFKATSLPMGSGWFYCGAIILGLFGSWLKRKIGKNHENASDSDPGSTASEQLLAKAEVH